MFGLGERAKLMGDRAAPRELEPRGVIDIGSNSVRLVVYEGAVRSPTPLFNEKVLCGLGRELATSGRLGDEAMDRALAAMLRFRVLAQNLAVAELRAIATAAVREASNGPDFIVAAEKVTGCTIEILSGEAEAELAAQGVTMGFNGPDGFVGDLGGGSLELIDIHEGGLHTAATTPLGVLRLVDSSRGRVEKSANEIDKELDAIPWLDDGAGRPFYAVGGTWRAVARMHMEATEYPLRVMHGYSIPTGSAIKFCEKLRKTKRLATLPGYGRISRARRDVLPYGAFVLERLLKRMQPSEVVFSAFGIREGLLYSMLSDEEKARDPLISFCEDYATLRSRSYVHARELCDWTDQLFEAPGPRETDEERRLRHAACLISDIGWRAHPDYRGDQSLNVVAHAALSGVGHEGRIFLALSVYFRHAGLGASHEDHLSERIKSLVDSRLLRRAWILGAAVRTAHLLSAGMPGVTPQTKLVYEKGNERSKLVLQLPSKLERLVGERIERRLQTLAQLIQCEPKISII